MLTEWKKRLSLIVVSCLFYVALEWLFGWFIYNNVLDWNLKPINKYEKFLGINYLVVFLYVYLLNVLLKKKCIPFDCDCLSIPTTTTIVLAIVFTYSELIQPIEKAMIVIPVACVIYMIYASFKLTEVSFLNTVWKPESIDSYWVFNTDNTMSLCSPDGSTTTYKWKFNPYSNTLTVWNNNESRLYRLTCVANWSLTLTRLSSGEIISFRSDRFRQLNPAPNSN